MARWETRFGARLLTPQEHRVMSGHDGELDLLRNDVSCAALLEHLPPSWRLDKPGSTRRALKYRRGEGEILIVNHDGRGWWDPQSTAKGDVFDLIQHLDPALNFGQVRQVLRRFVGITPTYPEAAREKRRENPDRPIVERWQRRPRLRPGSPAWTYLADERCLPGFVLELAAEIDAVREGFHGSASCFIADIPGAHRVLSWLHRPPRMTRNPRSRKNSGLDDAALLSRI